jgi:large subunit ribosomal protein L25
MAVLGKMSVKRRTASGSNQCKNLRNAGGVPGNLYGHKQETIPLQAMASELEPLIRTGTRVLNIDVEGTPETAIFREVQWDYLGKQIVHFDLLRVDPNERLTVEVKVELKGTAPGTLAGGVLDHTLRTLSVECLAIQIPDSIIVKIANLEVGQAIHIRELEVPPDTRILNNPEAIVVRVAERMAEIDLTAGVPGEEGPVQPELIGRKPEEGEEADAEAAAPEKKKA